MKTRGQVWIFYDTVNEKKTKPMNLVQAQSAVLSFSQRNMSKILIWTPGWEKWVPLDRYLDSNQDYFMTTPELSKVTVLRDDRTVVDENYQDQTTKTEFDEPDTQFTKIVNEENPTGSVPGDYGYYHPDFRADQININIKPKLKFDHQNQADNNQEDKERRKNERLSHKIEVTLVSKKGKTFKTYSDNISLGGLQLQDSIPIDFLNTTFNLILHHRTETNSKKSRIHIDGRIIGDMEDLRHLTFISLDEQSRKNLEEMLIEYQAAFAKIPNKKIS